MTFVDLTMSSLCVSGERAAPGAERVAPMPSDGQTGGGGGEGP